MFIPNNGSPVDPESPTLTSTSIPTFSDLRSFSKPLLRHHAHLDKYFICHTAQPIPYATALTMPTESLLPGYTQYPGFPPKWLYFAAERQPPTIAPRDNRRRVFSAVTIARQYSPRKHCRCWGCRRKIKGPRKFRESDALQAAEESTPGTCCPVCDGLDLEEPGIDLVQLPYAAEDRWAKLVDDAVHVWEGKRRLWAEDRGWEVCSESEGEKPPRPESALSVFSVTGSEQQWSEIDEEVEGEGESSNDDDWEAILVV